jgi:hypothetical protein
MTKLAFSANNNGTGTFVIASPDSNTNRTLLLPDATTTTIVGTDTTQTLTNKSIDAAQLTGTVAADRINPGIDARTGAAKTWQSVTRTVGTNYQNTTGYPLEINVSFTSTSAATVYIDVGASTGSYVRRVSHSMATNFFCNISIIIPIDWYYKWERQLSNSTVDVWSERTL